MKIKLLILVSAVIIFSGCSSKNMVTYNVNSVPSGAKVDVNDMYIGDTPTQINLECQKRWVGLLNAPDGYANASGSYTVKAYPNKFAGISQTKNIDPCQWTGKGKPSLQFDLALETVKPTETHNININSENSKLQEKLNALKMLRDSQVISKEEYKEKSLQLLQQ